MVVVRGDCCVLRSQSSAAASSSSPQRCSSAMGSHGSPLRSNSRLASIAASCNRAPEDGINSTRWENSGDGGTRTGLRPHPTPPAFPRQTYISCLVIVLPRTTHPRHSTHVQWKFHGCFTPSSVSGFAALIWRRDSEICQLPVEAQRTLGAFFRQQQRALHLCVVLRDRQLNFIATKE